LSVRRASGSLRALGAGIALLVVGLPSSGCQEVASNLVEVQPYEVEPIDGTDLNRVRLSSDTAEKVDLQTAEVRANGRGTVVPHEALIYSPEGEAFVYTRPEPQTYVRAPIEVERIVDDQALLSAGPPSGTVVVTVGAAELLATEFEILNQHP
jgi:multidrug efflux pump subunit AcrA (membrane-fusion protein)